MSNVIWKINGTPAADLGVKVAGGDFRTQGVSDVRLEVAADFDEAEIFSQGDTVAITRTESASTITFFQGKVGPVSKYGDAGSEGHSYPVEDAWADLERTTYQEEWAIGNGAYFLPKAVLGMDSAGELLSIGEQIGEVIDYAISVGVALQMGSVPASSEVLWPQEVSNLSCSEVINQCLEFHPDWVPWLDHSTTPPTFNVVTTAEMDLVTLETDGSGILEGFEETRRDDLIPDSVRIVYEYATTIDNDVFRNATIDKYPTGGPEGGPGVLCTTIPLAGGQMQMQKSRIRVRPMPQNGDKSAVCKKWVKANYPRLKDVDLEDFTIVSFKTSLHEDDDPHADPISARAQRLIPTDLNDVPNQLLEGNIEDWMRKKVGWVNFEVIVTPANSVNRETWEKIKGDFPPGRCVCTNALTKIYKGVTQWVPPEDVPQGIAQAVYESMTAAYLYQGTATVVEADLGTTRYHGKKIALTGTGISGVMIHSVSWDVDSGRTTIGFGPVPELAPADFIEMQRRLRSRKVTWWSPTERADAALGAIGAPSAAGDSVGGYHGPQTIMDTAAGLIAPFMPVAIAKGQGGNFDVTLQPGHVREINSDDGEAVEYWVPKVGNVLMDDATPPKIAMKLDDFVYVKYLTDKEGTITEDPTVEVDPGTPVSIHYQPINGDAEGSGGSDGTYYVKVGQLVAAGEDGASWVPFVASDIVHWHELWTGENLGDDANIYKERDPETNVYKFRCLKGRFGLVAEEEDERVVLDFIASNLSTGASVFIDPADKQTDPEAPLPDTGVRFRTLRAMNTDELTKEGISEQLVVLEAKAQGALPDAEDETILIRGNSKSAKLKFVKPAVGTADPELIKEVRWEDGFVNEEDDIEVEIPEGGASLNLTITHWGEGTTGVLQYNGADTYLYWRKGLFVGNTDPGDSPEDLVYETVSDVVLLS